MSSESNAEEEPAKVLGDRPIRAEELLAEALRAPGRPSELAGLETALAAFRTAQSSAARPDGEQAAGEPAPHSPDRVGAIDPSPAPRRRAAYWRRPILTATVSASLLLAAATAAAERGALPTPVQQMAHTVLGGIGVPKHSRHHPEPGTVGTGAPSGPGTTPAPTGQPAGTSSSSPGPFPSPTLSDLNLCTTILVDQKGLHSKTIDPAARNHLTAAAGGEDHIIAYCETLLTAAGISYPPPPATTTEHRPSPAPARSRTSSR